MIVFAARIAPETRDRFSAAVTHLGINKGAATDAALNALVDHLERVYNDGQPFPDLPGPRHAPIDLSTAPFPIDVSSLLGPRQETP